MSSVISHALLLRDIIGRHRDSETGLVDYAGVGGDERMAIFEEAVCEYQVNI